MPPDALEKPRSLGAASSPMDVAALAGMRVLLVEDVPDNRLLVGRLLSSAGASVETAESGEEGVWRALAGGFDIVLMDIQMPGMDGHEANRILQEHRYPAPVLALTAHASEVERDRCLDEGFCDYLTKPVTRQGLVSVLTRIRADWRPARGVHETAG